MTEGKQLPLVRDFYRFNDKFSELESSLANERYQYLLKRRDQLQDRARNGVLALNAVSLLGVLTALSTEMVEKGRFGLGISDLAFCGCAFIVGLLSAVIGLAGEVNRMPHEAATQYDRLSRQMRQRAALEQVATDKNIAKFKECMDDVHKLPQADFGISYVALWGTNIAGGAWIAGILLPLIKVGALISW